jgi:chromatin segregation and condensation protein Rec8/ScpA/Scc1 (kleisin family)
MPSPVVFTTVPPCADTASRADLIVTFLALLEMIRLKLVRVFQTGAFGAIRVYKRARPADAPRPIGDAAVTSVPPAGHA